MNAVNAAIAPTGPYDVIGDYNTRYTGPGHGITAALRMELDALAAKFKLGIYDLNAGHGGLSTDPHEQGDAADITSVNGAALSYGSAPPSAVALAQAALQNPDVQIGTYPVLENAIRAADPAAASRIVEDLGTGPHLHIQIAAGQFDPRSPNYDPAGVNTPPQTTATNINATLSDPLGLGAWWNTATADIQFWIVNISIGMLMIAIVAGGLAIAAGTDNIDAAVLA